MDRWIVASGIASAPVSSRNPWIATGAGGPSPAHAYDAAIPRQAWWSRPRPRGRLQPADGIESLQGFTQQSLVRAEQILAVGQRACGHARLVGMAWASRKRHPHIPR